MLRWNNSISFMPRRCENITNGVSGFLHSDLMNQWKYLRYCWEDFRSPLLMRDKHPVFNLRNNFSRELSGWITTTLDKIILIHYVFWTCSAQLYLDLIAPYVDQLKLKSIQTSSGFDSSILYFFLWLGCQWGDLYWTQFQLVKKIQLLNHGTICVCDNKF